MRGEGDGGARESEGERKRGKEREREREAGRGGREGGEGDKEREGGRQIESLLLYIQARAPALRERLRACFMLTASLPQPNKKFIINKFYY